MGDCDLTKSIQGILAKILQGEEQGYAVYNKREVAKRIYEDADFDVNRFRINFLLELLTDESEKNKNLIQKFLTKLLKEDDAGYALYHKRMEAKRNYEDANFDVNKFRINFLLYSFIQENVNERKTF